MQITVLQYISRQRTAVLTLNAYQGGVFLSFFDRFIAEVLLVLEQHLLLCSSLAATSFVVWLALFELWVDTLSMLRIAVKRPTCLAFSFSGQAFSLSGQDSQNCPFSTSFPSLKKQNFQNSSAAMRLRQLTWQQPRMNLAKLPFLTPASRSWILVSFIIWSSSFSFLCCQGVAPKSISQHSTPSEKKSVFGEQYVRSRAYGAMYAGVPTFIYPRQLFFPITENPKSQIFQVGPDFSMFGGLRSRCSTFCFSRYLQPDIICSIMPTVVLSASLVCLLMKASKVPCEQYSRTKQQKLAFSMIQQHLTTLGWSSWPCTSIYCFNSSRFYFVLLSLRLSITFMANWFLGLSSLRARQTLLVKPSPNLFYSSYQQCSMRTLPLLGRGVVAWEVTEGVCLSCCWGVEPVKRRFRL